MKLLIWIGIIIGGTVGSAIGAWLTKGNWLSLGSIILGGIGSLIGVTAGYTVAKNYL